MRRFLSRYSRIRRVIGVALIVIGLLALVTPLTPGSWLIFIGLELAGIKILGTERIRAWWDRKRE